MEQDGGRAQAGRSEGSESQGVAGGQGEKRKVEDGDDIDAERLVGGVEFIDEEFVEVCVNEVAKMMKTESADEEYDCWGEVEEQVKDAKV